MNKKNLVRITNVEPNRLHAKDLETQERLTLEVDEVIAEDFRQILKEKHQLGEGVFMTREEFLNG
ncbi:hypothetical protein DW615_13625 [Enterococcus faecalis]|uniref:hypothetical protein n=1 Tax=Enterococcus faecalis TaxID=1351 RepID=UPI00100E9218|nr:hypothetical protein [Enterococcus faecalis]EGO9069313.1 hypothetical protein [Enterococcus faecalis]EHE8476135.1 hypothetical protein [Enterococcus faecalis]EJE4072158.1 hypothetical protein [Enterococcus faecalis]ELU9044989.1 hypothetical protein [Enterococcus faecalis]RXN54235.1 hypothetical protein CYQ22_12790 [Enterococcus faecalis]